MKLSVILAFSFITVVNVNATENGKIKCVLESEDGIKHTLVSYEIPEDKNVASFLVFCGSDEEHTSCNTLPVKIVKSDYLEMETNPNSEAEYHMLMGYRNNKINVKHSVINSVFIRKGMGVETILKVVYNGKEQRRYGGYCSGSMISITKD